MTKMRRGIANGVLIGGALIFATCQYDPYTARYATARPDPTRLVGLWTATPSSMNRHGRTGTMVVQPQIELLADGTIRMTNVPEGWRSGETVGRGGDWFDGQWSLEPHQEWWGLRLTGPLVQCSGCLMVMHDRPPHLLVLRYGDPDQGLGVEFEGPSGSENGGMPDRQLAAFTEMVRAVNAGDAKAYARLYAPDAVITIHGSGKLAGRDAIEQHEVELLREFPGARLGFNAVWQEGPSAVVHYAVNGRTPGGQAMGHEGLLFYRFHPSGLIAEERRYLDSLTPMAQLGMFGPQPARALPAVPTGVRTYVAKGSPTESENVALVRASFAAFDAKDESAFLSRTAEDAVLDEMTDPRPRVGKPGVKAWFEAWARAAPDARSEITSILAAGEFVLVEMLVRGTLKGPLGRLAASNREFAVHRAAILEVKDGRLTRIVGFMNGKELAEAAGQWPPRGGR